MIISMPTKVLAITDLCKTYGDLVAADGISFEMIRSVC